MSPVRFAHLALLFTALFYAAVPSAPAAAQPAALEGFDEYVESAMADWEVPGLALAVVKDDEVIYARGYGVTERGGDEQVDEHTLFAIASTTKAFTAAALAILVEEGRLDWDDPVRHHMPEFELNDPFVTREITVRDLLTHRVGLAGHNNVWIAAPFDRGEIIRRLRYLPQARGFRSGYLYNNIMYIVAGELVGSVSGISWGEFLERRIFEPLGMTRTTTRFAVADSIENVTSSHTRVDGEVTPLYRRNYDALGGAGSMFSSAHEMARWIRLHLNAGEFEATRLIDSTLVAEMHAPQIATEIDASDRRLFPDRSFSAYGLAWRLHDYRGRKVVQHTGTVNYTRTQVGMMPSEGIGFVALSNLTTAELQTALMYRVFDALLGLPETDWSARYLEISEEEEVRESAAVPPRVAGTDPSLDLARYAGRYTDDLYGDVNVDLEGESLVLRYSPEYVADLEHWHYDTFRALWRPTGFGSTFATFSRDHEGEIDSMDLRGFTVFERAEDGPASSAAEPD